MDCHGLCTEEPRVLHNWMWSERPKQAKGHMKPTLKKCCEDICKDKDKLEPQNIP